MIMMVVPAGAVFVTLIEDVVELNIMPASSGVLSDFNAEYVIVGVTPLQLRATY
jgi:flavin reductase (DIM6/NTAB) family NADH-FMN oxidoreductase RutF